jgi:uncharacterized protein (TIGR03437 family)
LLAAAFFAVWPAWAQKTTSISLVNLSGPTALVTVGRPVSFSGTGTITPLGNATVSFTGSQDQTTTTLIQGSLAFFFNRLDSFSVSVPNQAVFGRAADLTVTGPISGGTGAYSGASGSVTYRFKYTATTSSSGNFTLTGSGNIKIGQTTTPISLASFSGPASVADMASGTLLATPTGSVAPFGNVTVNYTGIKNRGAGKIQGVLTFVFNGNDSFNASFSFVFNLFAPALSLPCTITGGTGVFRGATGSLAASVTLTPDGKTFTITGTGTITQPAQGGPVITSVKTAFGASYIAQNTWIEIKGTNLVPSTTPAGGVYWSNAPEFASGRMPTQVGGISVTINGKPAYVWWFCSAVTTSACASDQINVLSPLDATVGQVDVVVSNQNVSSAPMSVNMLPIAPSVLVFDTTGHSVAEHTDFSLLGPAGLFPGKSTPARPLEVVIVYAIGFGLPAAPLVDGSATQSGALPVLPVCQMGGAPAPVTAAVLITPGLYALFVTVPGGASGGDQAISCSYQSSPTPAGNLITVQQ